MGGDDQVSTGLACPVTDDARFYVHPLLHGSKDTKGRQASRPVLSTQAAPDSGPRASAALSSQALADGFMVGGLGGMAGGVHGSRHPIVPRNWRSETRPVTAWATASAISS